MNYLTLLLCLSMTSSSLPHSKVAAAATPSGSIHSTTDQQILTTVLPDSDQNTQPFLTSPSGTYTAYLLRHGDSCYIQIQETDTEKSVWESECTPVSGNNACMLAFSPLGLELLDGEHSVWDTGIDVSAATLSLNDDGQMQEIDKDGGAVWKESNEPRLHQECTTAPQQQSNGVPPGPDQGNGGDDGSIQPLPPPTSDALPGSSTGGNELVPPPPSNDVLPSPPELPLDSPPPLASPMASDISTPLPLPPPPSDMPSISLPITAPEPQPSSSDLLPSSPELPPNSLPTMAPPTGGDSSMPLSPPPLSDMSSISPPIAAPSSQLLLPPPLHVGTLPGSPEPPSRSLPDATASTYQGGKPPFGQQTNTAFGQQLQGLNGGNQPVERNSGYISRSTRMRGSLPIWLAFLGLLACGLGV